MSLVRILMALGLVLGLWPPNVAVAQAALKEITILLPGTTFALANLRAADRMGLYEKHGLKPKFVMGENGATIMSALLSGTVEFVSTGMDELIALRAQGNNDVGIVVNGYRGLAAVVVLRKDVADKLSVKPDASPEARMRALDGLLLASPSPTSTLLSGLKAGSAKYGITMRYTYMQQPAMAAALQTGAIQGYVSTSPFWESTISGGFAVRWLSGPRGEFPQPTTTSNSALQTTYAYAKKNPDVVRAIHATFDDFSKAIRERPAEITAAMKQVYPEMSDEVMKGAFAENSPNWVQIELSEADMRNEIDMRRDQHPNVAKIEPASLLIPR